MDRKSLQAVYRGERRADLAITGGKIVNVLSKEIYEGDVAVVEDRIVSIGDVSAYIGPDTKIIDATDKFVAPGFIDGHIHPESTNLSIRSFAEILLKHGTTSIMTDLHEIGIVSGLQGIEAVLEEAKETDLKLWFVVPSHVPFAPDLETSGGEFDSTIIKKALEREDAVGLSEIVAPYLVMGYPDLMKAIDLTLQAGKSLQGHLPETTGTALDACIAAGVSTDHESLHAHEALERIRNGCHVMMREGSAARNMPECLKIITENKVDTTLCSIVTDDLHTIDAVDRGHLDDAVRTAIANGVDFLTAIQMVTINAARAFHLDWEVGSLAPGRMADINLISNPEKPVVETVIAKGKEVLVNGKLMVSYPKAKHDPCLMNTVILPGGQVKPRDLGITVDPKAKQAKVLGMRTLDWIPITIAQEGTLPVRDGIIQADIGQDLLLIAQVERYGKNGNIGKAFMAGFNLQEGAMASSIAHDNHNVIVIGTNLEDMALAVNRCAELDGGQVVVVNGEVKEEVSYPVCGLLSDLSAEDLADKKRALIKASQNAGSKIGFPFMFLSFIGLAAIPEYAITDKGFIDVLKQQIIDPVKELVY
jgi:adenine deaminase